MDTQSRASATGKGRRSWDRRGTRGDKSPPVTRRTKSLPEPTVCQHCGSVFARQTWRRDRPVTHSLLARASWVVCPACVLARRREGFGKVVIRGAYVAANYGAIRRRIDNVAERAGFTQPQRRVVSVSRESGAIEVLTTSQKLAHRIAHELKKAFRGRTSYAWSDRDGALLATWERDDVPAARPARRRR